MFVNLVPSNPFIMMYPFYVTSFFFSYYELPQNVTIYFLIVKIVVVVVTMANAVLKNTNVAVE